MDACLGEEDVKMMVDCIRLDRDCANICFTAVELMANNSPFAAQLCDLCAQICDACADECEKHDADHCHRCAEVCRRCAEECRRMAAMAA
ncbi:four-helix bundle copper-binding protein [Telluribacter sp. SYSU D00476]|uniref:four-helix bundle copper-binding protein n=1 Tax=Telluribacter sp. SYSU D00476 TaxID=2811430 RepID=UPI00286E8051|nr:four-helix bundle copper-binding protein [Telluribacter sp. SYSU D00476]